MADYDWFDRSGEMEEHFRIQRLRSQGFHPVFDRHNSKPKYFECRRGCGTLVWDVEAHTENVCPTFDPRVAMNGKT